MADTGRASPPRRCSTNWRASIRRSGGRWPPLFVRGLSKTLAEVPHGRDAAHALGLLAHLIDP
jgi:hypothetical protein